MTYRSFSTHAIAVTGLIFCFLMLCFLAWSANVSLKAVITASNDFTTDDRPAGKRVPVPNFVARKIGSLVDKAYSEVEPSERRYFSRQSFFGPVFRISAPGGRELYVFRLTGPMGGDFFYFIVFDPVTQKVTNNPPYIYAKWMAGADWGAELKKPLLSFEDIDGDGQPEYVAQERVHNGTMYNAVVYHYYYVLPDLGLRPILAVETRLFDLFTQKKNEVITRTVRKLGKGEIRLEVTLDYRDPTPVHRELGSVVLRSSQPGNPFKIVERTVVDSTYEPVLITASEEDEAKFIVKGYGFYY